jgi:hypothetical protein
MEKNGYYKHVNCTDVAIEVLRITHIPEKNGYKVKVSWMNVASGKFAYPLGYIEEIFIPSSLIRDWQPWQKSTTLTKSTEE